MAINKTKNIFFSFIAAVPWVILCVLTANVSINVYRANNADYPGMIKGVEDFIFSDKAEVKVSFYGERPDKSSDAPAAEQSPGGKGFSGQAGQPLLSGKRWPGRISVEYAYLFPDDGMEAYSGTVVFDPSEDVFDIVVLGSSPVVAKPPFAGEDFFIFPEVLEKKLNMSSRDKRYRVHALGFTSADSFVLKKIAEQVMGFSRVDLVVYYYGGGMDLETAYRSARVKEEFYPLKSLSGKRNRGDGASGILRKNKLRTYLTWFNRAYLQPYLINFLQKAGLLRVPHEPFGKINDLIIRNIGENMAQTAGIMKDHNIPIVFVTSLSNLEAKPYGIAGITDSYYERGMRESDHFLRFKYLSMARDTEIFTGDLGPRTDINDTIKRIPEALGEGVYCFDLAGHMVDSWQGFSYKYFYDYGHMKPVLHELVAAKIYGYLSDKGLL